MAREDAQGYYREESCPKCGSLDTISYLYHEGFDELSCQHCGYNSEDENLAFASEEVLLATRRGVVLPIPSKGLKA